MSTKSSPGRFNCYAAAFPDETIFTLLARDPALPATVRFWVGERIRLGKDQTDDDKDRLAAALEEAEAAAAWRERNLDPFGDGTPTWRVKMNFVDDETSRPIRLEKVSDPIGVQEAMAFIRAEVERITGIEDAKGNALGMIDHVIRSVDAMEPILVTRLLTGDIEPPEQPPFRAVRTILDDENHDDLALVEERGHGVAFTIQGDYVVGGDQEAAYAAALRYAALMNAGAGAPDMTVPTEAVISAGRVLIHGVPMSVEEIEARLYPDSSLGLKGPGPDELGTMERVLVDAAPHDIAHSPEVPPHRFATFVKGERYAYARGLEIAPVHLPRALDAMAVDGWELLAIFGQTDSKHVGFIFERRPEPLVISHGFNWPESADVDRIIRETVTSKPEMVQRLLDTRPMEEGLARAQRAIKGLPPVIPEGMDAEIEVHISATREVHAGDAKGFLYALLCRAQWPVKARVVCLVDGQAERGFDISVQPDHNCSEYGRGLEP